MKLSIAGGFSHSASARSSGMIGLTLEVYALSHIPVLLASSTLTNPASVILPDAPADGFSVSAATLNESEWQALYAALLKRIKPE